jgi:hypothetical protein
MFETRYAAGDADGGSDGADGSDGVDGVRVLSVEASPVATVYELEFPVEPAAGAGALAGPPEWPSAEPPDGRLRCAATLTVPGTDDGGGHRPGALQILVHGATYNRWYWDPSVWPEKYSFVHAATMRGHATLNLDLVGSGRSSAPAGKRLGLELHAATVDRIARLARDDLVGHRWEGVVGVGHSLGTCVLMRALDAYDSLSAAVLTGVSHEAAPGPPPEVTPIDAAGDPVFQRRNVSGYLTMPAGSRPYYYHLPSTEPAMLFEDERHRDVVAQADVDDYARAMAEPCGARVPLLIGLGMCDWVFAARADEDFTAAESRWYPQAPAIDFRVYPDTGNNINLHGASDHAIADFLDWIERLGD